MVYCSNQVAGIYAMSTKEEFRIKKIASSAVHACLKIAKSYNLKYAVLYASNLGAKLYQATGFEVIKHYHEFNFNNSNK
jgi:predicted acetyltransferase